MPIGLFQTEQALARVRNRAVLPVLAIALSSQSPEVRAAAIRATLRRCDLESHTQLIRHFHALTDDDRAVLRETYVQISHHARPALRRAILHGDVTACRNACDIVLLCRDYELFATLVLAMEAAEHRHAEYVGETVLKFAVRLRDEMLAWMEGGRHGHDPSFARRQVLIVLEKSLARNVPRHPTELVDAFLLLSPSDNAALAEMLRARSHPCHAQLVEALALSNTTSSIERLVALLRDTDAADAVLDAIARRTDRAFVSYLLHELKQPVPLRVASNMKRLQSVAWLESEREILLELDGHSQASAVELALTSGIDEDSLLGLLKLILQQGCDEGRRASCRALASVDSPEVSGLVLQALDDPDSGVQAAAVKQLRPRRIRNAMQLLVARLASPFVEVRDAARSCLSEFNFARYRAMFELLDEQTARTTGVLVRQVDHSTREKLIEELMLPAVGARLRAIEMVVAMEAVDDVADRLCVLTRNENVSVRAAAVMALGYAKAAGVTEALELALRDSNRVVADAARNSLDGRKDERQYKFDSLEGSGSSR